MMARSRSTASARSGSSPVSSPESPVLASRISRENPSDRRPRRWLLLLPPSPAGAQVQAPSLVEGELPRRGAEGEGAARSGEAVPEPALPPEPLPPPPAAPAPARRTALPGRGAGREHRPRGAASKLQRPIEPVGDLAGPGRGAVAGATQGGPGAGRRRRAGPRPRRSATPCGSSASRASPGTPSPRCGTRSGRSRARARGRRASEHAVLAVALAPDLAEPHLALARARIAAEPARPLPALSAAWAGLVAAARDPHVARALLGDVAGAALAALFGAAAATIGVLFLSPAAPLPARLPAPAGGPLAARPASPPRSRSRCSPCRSSSAWGPSPCSSSRSLRGLGLPLDAGSGSPSPSPCSRSWPSLRWPGRPRGSPPGRGRWPTTSTRSRRAGRRRSSSAEMKARSDARAVPGARRCSPSAAGTSGRATSARRAAGTTPPLEADPRSAEAQVNLGNVLFLEGDLEGAKAAYLAAVERAQRPLHPGGGAVRPLQALPPARRGGAELRGAAQGPAGRRRLPGAVRLGRRLPRQRLAGGRAPVRGPAGRAGRPRRRARAPSGRRCCAGWPGRSPRWGWPCLPLGARRLALGRSRCSRPRLAPAAPCERCGRPACRRCDPAATRQSAASA